MSSPSKPDVGDDPDMRELQSNFNEQQAKIIALREIIRQTEVANDMKHATAQEKVKNIAQRLTHFKTKVTTSRLNRANSANTSLNPSTENPSGKYTSERTDAANTSFQRGRSESSSMEKCSLLRKQIEKNRMKMAERESCKREIQEKVIEIKHRLETTQQSLEKTTELDQTNAAIEETLPPDISRQLVDRSNKPEATITQSIRTHDDTPWLNSTACGNWPESEASLQKEFSQDNEANFRETEVNPIKFDHLENENKILKEGLYEKNTIIDEQIRMISQLVNNLTGFESTWREDAHRDLCLITELQHLQLELLKKSSNISLQEAETHLLHSYGYDPVARVMENVEKVHETPTEINKKMVEETGDINLRNALEKIASLEQTISIQDIEIDKLNQQMNDLRYSLEEKTVELNVMTANVSVLQEKLKTSCPKPLFPRSVNEEFETESSKLKQQLDESNKNMIKCKLRMKQLQKQVDTFKKMSNAHEEVARLTEEIHMLSLTKEKEKKNNQLTGKTHIDEDTLPAETLKRIELLELTCQNQASAMQLLEEQKNDLSEDLCRTRNELLTLSERAAVTESVDNGRIASQMLSIELEEQLEKCLADKTELTKVLHSWEAGKTELQQKLKQCMEENGELLSKIEKLSIEKVSSAESIEILENLTLHEKQEMEKSEKIALGQEIEADLDGETKQSESKENLNESLLKLMEESKELMDKVEMFTDERREVLEKLDAISIENQAYICELDKLKEANEQLRSYSVELASAKTYLEEKLRTINDEKESILHQLETARTSIIKEEEISITATKNLSTSTSESSQEVSFCSDTYEQALVAAEVEVANYNKNKDKQKKLQVSKKLAANTKNLVTMTKQLLNDYKSCVIERSLLSDQIALLSQQIENFQQVHAASSYRKQDEVAGAVAEIVTRLDKSGLDELKHELEIASEKSSDDEPELLKVELNSKNDEIIALRRIMESQAKAKMTELLQLQQQLVDAQKEAHQLQLRAAQADELMAKCDLLLVEKDSNEEMIQTLRAEVKKANEIVEQQLETIAAMETRIDELSQTVEEYNSSQSSVDGMTQRIAELTTLLSCKKTDDDSEKAELERKNQELLDKLKKFAANLKRKNVQCNELEQENKQLTELNQQLLEEQQKNVEDPIAESDIKQLREENESLAQKLHHLNNELHRLLENKYQMEAELRTSREKVEALNEQLLTVHEKETVLDDRLHQLEEELEAQRAELESGRKELVSKNSKIEKCKAIIKEKIKETHRLQEHERRTTYLEDELRMTQSKLEDFHNQTLLLGRLKSEKEELNALLKAECEQRRYSEQLLDKKNLELEAVYEKERHVHNMLARVETWVRSFGDKWKLLCNNAVSCNEVEMGNISDLFDWCDVLSNTDSVIKEAFTKQTNDLCEANRRLQEADLITKSLHAEIEETKTQLMTMQNECIEQKQTIFNLTQELEHAQGELQHVMKAHSEMSQQQSELHSLQSQLQASDDVRSSLQQTLAAMEHSHMKLLQEMEQVREKAASYEELIKQEKMHAVELLSANKALQNEIEASRKQAQAIEKSYHDLQLQYSSCKEEHDLKLVQLRDEFKAKESKIVDELRRKDDELDSLRDEYEQQLIKETQVKDQMSDALRRKDQEIELLRKNHEELLFEEIQAKEQLNEALAGKNQELQLVRKNYEEQLLGQTQTNELLMNALELKDHDLESMRKVIEVHSLEKSQSKDRVNDVIRERDAELAALRKNYEEQLMETVNSKEQFDHAIQQKDKELQNLHLDYEQKVMEQIRSNDKLKEREQELETMCKRFEKQVMEQTIVKDKLNDTLRQKEQELHSLRNRVEEQANKLPIKDQLEDLHDAELEELRQDYEEQLKEIKQSKEQLHAALERKDNELESLRKTYKDCCEQQDVLSRRHFQELDSVQQKLLESVGERVALQQSIDNITRKVDDQTQEIVRLRAQVASLEKQRSENLTNTSILSSLNEALNDELDQLEERMNAREGGPDGAATNDNNLQGVIRQKNEIIEQLGAQQKLMQQEITDLKVKAGKLLRKLKETRARCDVLEATNAPPKAVTEVVGGWEVETASQDLSNELRDSRVQILESRLNDSETELAKIQCEKDTLMIKLDTLETACDKLTELKEQQDKQIEMLQTTSQDQELRDRLQHTIAALQTRESEMVHLKAQLQELVAANQTVEQLRAQLRQLENNAAGSTLTTNPIELQLAELKQANSLLESEKLEMSRELEILNQQILHDLQFEERLQKAMLELDAKNVELQMLRSTVEQMQSSGSGQAESATGQDQIAILEARVLELEHQKAYYEQQLEIPMEAIEYERVAETVPQLPEIVSTNLSVNTDDVRNILERQELEIVTLKEQLAVRSAEYARLAAHVDPTRLLSLIKSGSSVPAPEQQQNADRDSRAELELALYMIYQRDMRCDELELELRNLLEERDALQLRLSNALRMHEEYRLKCTAILGGGDSVECGTSGECSIESSPEKPITTIAPADDSRPMSSMSTAADTSDLSSKLSELHSISYSKEKRWQEEREDRNRQLTLIQRDLANMPLEAAAKITGTDVVADSDTQSQQSASSVLLNWILGKK